MTGLFGTSLARSIEPLQHLICRVVHTTPFFGLFCSEVEGLAGTNNGGVYKCRGILHGLPPPVCRRSCRRRHLPTSSLSAFRPPTTSAAVRARGRCSQAWRSRSPSTQKSHSYIASAGGTVAYDPLAGSPTLVISLGSSQADSHRLTIPASPSGPGNAGSSPRPNHACVQKDEGRSEVDLAYSIRATTWLPCLPAGNMPSCITKAFLCGRCLCTCQAQFDIRGLLHIQALADDTLPRPIMPASVWCG